MIIPHKTTILLLFLIGIIPVHAQTDSLSISRIYDKEVIFFSGNKYIKNETKYPLNNLVNEFNINRESYQVYLQARVDSRKSGWLTLLSLGGYFTGIAFLDKRNDLAFGLMLSSMVPFGYSMHLGGRSDKKIKRAVWMRNKDILLNRN